MQIETQLIDNKLIIKPIDKSLSSDFKNYMINEISQGKNYILLNLVNIKKIDPSTLECLMSLYKAFDDKSSLGIYGLSQEALAMLNLSGLTKIIKVFKTEEEAIQNIGR